MSPVCTPITLELLNVEKHSNMKNGIKDLFPIRNNRKQLYKPHILLCVLHRPLLDTSQAAPLEEAVHNSAASLNILLYYILNNHLDTYCDVFWLFFEIIFLFIGLFYRMNVKGINSHMNRFDYLYIRLNLLWSIYSWEFIDIRNACGLRDELQQRAHLHPSGLRTKAKLTDRTKMIQLNLLYWQKVTGCVWTIAIYFQWLWLCFQSISKSN